ncbi:two-component system, OmpR family, sensor histidine kinase ChvG [Patescibacteria group bacterium]|nr:two-component system, OmpR family, sensor histidine kinase ChvG [Patescibacteria group bacterium]
MPEKFASPTYFTMNTYRSFRHRLFPLRTILLFVMLTVLALPLGGLYFFRIYENELVRQTELELIAQSATLSATYRQLVRVHAKEANYGRYLSNISINHSYEPIVPTLSLIDPIQSLRDPALPASPTDALAKKIGELMSPIIIDTQHITLSGIRVLDMNGVVIAGREEVGLSLAHVPEVKQALQGHYSSVIRQRISDEPPPPLYSLSRGTRIRVFVTLPVLENQRLQGVIYLSRTPNNIVKHLFEVKRQVLMISSTLLSVVVLLGLLVSSTISRPIRELIRQTERVKQGEQKNIEPLEYPVTYELAQLSNSFVSLSKALTERSDYIQRFATHVSHEFKTPLTSMQGALELLQDHLDSMPVEQQHRFIDNLLADTQRLKQLVNRLLELARADVSEPTQQHSELPVVIFALKNRYTERGLQLHYDNLPNNPLAIAPDALDIVLNNLLENSLQHGATQIKLHTELSEHHLELYIHDNGTGISEANRKKIFTPFFTTRRNTGGTGLGLEITRSLLKTYKASIELADSTQGALFILTLPLRSYRKN